MGFKPYLDDQLVSFSALDTVGLVIWPVKIVPEMTYNVLSGTLSLYTTTMLTSLLAPSTSWFSCMWCWINWAFKKDRTVS